jgi:hypothetical protein
MKTWLFAIGLAACAALNVVAAATSAYATSARVIEATSGSVVLPSGPSSALVVTPCTGCPPRSVTATATTTYFLKQQEVSLAQLTAALAGKPDVYVSIFQSTRTGELTRVVAALDAPLAK